MNERQKTPEYFVTYLAQVTTAIGKDTLDSELEARLNAEFPADGNWFAAAKDMCVRGCEEGWLCARESGGIKFGRAVPVSEVLGGMSVDVVEMNDTVGPHHSHPNGEIDLVMPLTPEAKFDGQSAGWKVYGPDTAHSPTVTDGTAIVLYLLPDGAIEFTRT